MDTKEIYTIARNVYRTSVVQANRIIEDNCISEYEQCVRSRIVNSHGEFRHILVEESKIREEIKQLNQKVVELTRRRRELETLQ